MTRRSALRALSSAARKTPPPVLDLPPSPANCPLAEAVCEALWPLLDACNEYLHAHNADEGGACSCARPYHDPHEDIRALRYIAWTAESVLSCMLTGWPAWNRRQVKECRRRGDHEAAALYRRLAKR